MARSAPLDRLQSSGLEDRDRDTHDMVLLAVETNRRAKDIRARGVWNVCSETTFE